MTTEQRLSVRLRLVCIWTRDNEYGYFSTGCGETFCLEDGTPKQNGLKFCCYCGSKLEQAGV